VRLARRPAAGDQDAAGLSRLRSGTKMCRELGSGIFTVSTSRPAHAAALDRALDFFIAPAVEIAGKVTVGELLLRKAWSN